MNCRYGKGDEHKGSVKYDKENNLSKAKGICGTSKQQIETKSRGRI